MTKMGVRTIRALSAVVTACLLFAVACARTTEQRGTGETHFLYRCTEVCGAELRCIAAACTRTCEDDDACTGLAADATCEALPEGAGSAGVTRACDVVCGRDQDCATLGSDFGCEDGRCRSESDTGVGTPDAGADARTADTGTPDAGADTGTPDAGAPSCPSGCVAVNGYGEDPGQGCVDRARLGFVGCDCNPAVAFPQNPAAVPPQCGRRTTDDTLWVFHAGELSADSGIAECTPAESERVTYSCEFAACEVPPLSICSLEDTCGAPGCDNLQSDAQGCLRPECASDAECGEDERCVLLPCLADDWCTTSNPGPDEACVCSRSTLCREGGACNPVTRVGPRGAWQLLRLVTSAQEGCPGPDCDEIRTVDPSGAMLVDPIGTTETRMAMLSQDDRTELAQMIDGPSFRLGARDGFDCGDAMVQDVTASLVLELPDMTLTQSVTDCAFGFQPDEHELARLEQMLRAY